MKSGASTAFYRVYESHATTAFNSVYGPCTPFGPECFVFPLFCGVSRQIVKIDGITAFTRVNGFCVTTSEKCLFRPSCILRCWRPSGHKLKSKLIQKAAWVFAGAPCFVVFGVVHKDCPPAATRSCAYQCGPPSCISSCLRPIGGQIHKNEPK